MKGLDLCREYYSSVIKPIIDEHISFIGEKYASALIGWGSDVLGNDDEISTDHEWGPRCIIFLPEGLKQYKDRMYEILNTRIPSTFMGYPTHFIVDKESMGVRKLSSDRSGNVHIDITTCKDYFQANLGVLVPQNEIEWLSIPENHLREVTGGEVFFDGMGKLTKLRKFYGGYYPDDVWKYRLAYAWQSLGWDIDLIGLCCDRGDVLSSRYCLNETIFRIIRLAFLLNRRYAPSYPKWIHREFYKLPSIAKEIGTNLENIYIEKDIKIAMKKITQICRFLIEYQNRIKKLPSLKIRQNPYCRGYMDIDFQYIAEQTYRTIYGELKSIPIYGALDQWITNEDFLLDANKMKSLSAIYKYD
ncbi:MAG TPA: hypothetical protein DD426_06295 [Clostridiaceae bacterium]|nr:hypothetical protein [Clostridiaceae bacterium]